MVQITFEGHPIDVAPGETLLQALIRARTEPSYSCLAGLCHSCLLQAQAGEIPPAAQSGLSPEQCEQQLLLACQCRPVEPLQLQRPKTLKRTDAVICGLQQLSTEITELRLATRAPLPYHAGQHIDLWLGPYLSRRYSLASVPGLDGDLVFHIQRVRGGQFSDWIHTQACEGSLIQLGTAQGACCYSPEQSTRPLLLIGSGSGLGPLHGLLRDALNQHHRGQISLLHLGKSPLHLYLQEEIRSLCDQHPNLSHHPLVGTSDDLAVPLQSVLTHWDSRRVNAFVCGSGELVKEAFSQLRAAGVPDHQIHTDSFDAY
ncbi:2Fe-2S iron-sulfur cluster-binding protein [Aestuariirhabdus sp. LZHN29]|uniref:2Fe-2S iron-sulfur cluster-binding protein n=1 Tax=Aestuariirhabdus sp. LZHN29 TaxID=3417462 RepID=UPI003CED2821